MSGVMKIAVRKFGPFEQSIAEFWAQFCEETGCDLELEAIPMDLHPLYEATLGATNGLASGDWDIALLNTDWISEAVETGAIVSLSPFMDQNPPEGFPEAWSEALLKMQTFGGAAYGLPFHDGPECLVFRKDLIEDPAEQSAFRDRFGKALKVPETWSELIEIATFFHRPEQNLYGTVVAGYPDGHNTVFDLCLQIWARGGSLTDDQGRVNIQHQAAEDALSFYRTLFNSENLLHPDSCELDSVQAGLAFSRGEVAMMVNWFGFASMCEVDPGSKVKGKVDIAPVPAAEADMKGVSLNAYWMYTIGSGSTNKQWAYEFIRFATNAQNDKRLTLNGGIGCRKSTWFDTEVNQDIPYYHKLEALHQNSKTLPRKSNWASISEVIDQLVLRVRDTQDDISALLAESQQAINKIENETVVPYGN
ncbi:extracellular solute-binding protein [Persicobacter diffluens]